MDDLEAAWDDLHAANEQLQWYVGRPAYEERRTPPWTIYAFDPRETPRVGHRSRDWTTIGPTEEQCIRNMAYCLREIAAGQVPK